MATKDLDHFLTRGAHGRPTHSVASTPADHDHSIHVPDSVPESPGLINGAGWRNRFLSRSGSVHPGSRNGQRASDDRRSSDSAPSEIEGKTPTEIARNAEKARYQRAIECARIVAADSVIWIGRAGLKVMDCPSVQLIPGGAFVDAVIWIPDEEESL